MNAFARALLRRFSNKEAVAVSIFALGSMLLLSGSASVLSLSAAAARDGSREGGIASGRGEETMGSLLADGLADEGRVDRGLCFTAYMVQRGDTLSGIADDFNVSLDTVVSFNGVKNARTLQPGKILKIPSMSGILYAAKAGDSATAVAAAHGISADRIIETNGLMSDALAPGRSIFLPDAKLASFTLREISGDLFAWPARGWISSWYGWRSDPFTGARVFHNGVDIGVDMGTPVLRGHGWRRRRDRL